MSVNKAIILGRLGKDPELRFTQSGAAVATFTVATSRFGKDQDGNKKEYTEWHNIVVWGQQGENCNKYLKKGREVFVEGEIRTRKYEKDGATRYFTEIVARDVRFIGGRGSASDDFGAPSGPSGGFDDAGAGEDDIPF